MERGGAQITEDGASDVVVERIDGLACPSLVQDEAGDRLAVGVGQERIPSVGDRGGDELSRQDQREQGLGLQGRPRRSSNRLIHTADTNTTKTTPWCQA